MFTRIVVGVDSREGGRDALALAACLQAAGGGELVALHACASEPLIREDVLVLVEAELARAGATGRAVVVTDRSPAHALRTIADREGAELIVVGSSRRGGADRIVAGDDAAATLHCAPCAVAVAPCGLAGSPHALRRIGVGLDDSRESRVALEVARRLAHSAGAALHAITVVTPTVPLWPAVAWNTAWAGDDPSTLQPDDRLLAAISAEVGDDVTLEIDGRHAVEAARRAQRRPGPARGGLPQLRAGAPAAARQHIGEARPPCRVSAARDPARRSCHGTRRAAHQRAAHGAVGARYVRDQREPRGPPQPPLQLAARRGPGANDGIVSTASLVLGVAASGASATAIVTAGIAGLVAGALSMAAGEYVSVSSQRDAEQADIRLEELELRSDPQGELRELTGSTRSGACRRRWPARSRSPCRAAARCRRTCAMSWASTSGGSRGRFRRPGPRRFRSRRARRCRCWPSRWRRRGRGSS